MRRICPFFLFPPPFHPLRSHNPLGPILTDVARNRIVPTPPPKTSVTIPHNSRRGPWLVETLPNISVSFQNGCDFPLFFSFSGRDSGGPIGLGPFFFFTPPRPFFPPFFFYCSSLTRESANDEHGFLSPFSFLSALSPTFSKARVSIHKTL